MRLCLNLVVVDVYLFIFDKVDVYFFYTKMMELKHGSQNQDTDFTIVKNFKAQTLISQNQGGIIQSL